MIEAIFKDIIINKKHYSNSRNGEQFEQKLKNKFKAYGFSEIVQVSRSKKAIEEIALIEKISKKKSKEIYKKIKEKILLKNSLQIEVNPFSKINNSFIFQPYGSQQFPDFIVFTKKHILPIEIKYTKNESGNVKLKSARPMWNSNLPKPNSIYIYGVSGKIVTFFLGDDILENDTRKTLLDFFENMENDEEKLDEKLEKLKNNFGIYPYVRKAYEHKSTKSTYIDLEGKKVVESYFSENANEREKRVIQFLESLDKDKK